MKILFLDQFSQMGGAQRCLAELLPGLLSRGWQVAAALPEEGPLAEILRGLGVDVTLVPLGNYSAGKKTASDLARFALGSRSLADALTNLLHAFQPHVVYANGPRLLPALGNLLTDTPLIFHSHSFLSKRYTVWLAGRALRKTRAHVIASSNFAARPLTPYLEPGRLKVIYNGTKDLGYREREPIRTWRIGLLGRIAPEKGQLEFVRAAKILSRQGVPARFQIFGASMFSDGKYEAAVRSEADAEIEFVGWSDSSILHEVDILAVPSPTSESTPRVIPEAFSAGTPVVAFRTGGIPELITHCETGYLTAERTPESLAVSLEEMMAADLTTVARNARQRWERDFTLARYQADVAGVISDVARASIMRTSTAASRTNPAAASKTGP